MLVRTRLAVLMVLAVLALSAMPFFVSPFSSSTGGSNQKGVLRLALVGTPTSLNQITAPGDCESCWRIIELEYAFGMPVMQNGSNYAQSGLFDWISTNSNSDVWNFNIRAGARWSDGIPITSADINFTFGLQSGYIINTPSDYFGLTGEIKSVQIINSSDIQFTLTQADANFGIGIASQSYFTPVPSHIWAGTVNYGANPNFGIDVTSGPFYHGAYVPGSSSMMLYANPYYWNGPGLSAINVTFVSSNAQAASLLQNGKVDLAQVDPSSASNFVGKSNFGVNIEQERGLAYLEYNSSQYPFNETFFRQAMAYSIDTASIVQNVYNGYGTAGVWGQGGIPPSATMWHNSSDSQYAYAYNLTTAKNLLLANGFSYSSAGGILQYPNSGSPVTFKIYTDTDVGTDELAANQVSAYLSNLGMQVSVVPTTLATISTNYTKGLGDIRSNMVVASSSTSIFGLGFLDIVPGYDWYYPWYVPQAHWMQPLSADSLYNNYSALLFNSPNAASAQQAVRDIDGLASQYLPVIVLAYPDTIWAYSNTSVTGFPSGASTTGFDMGDMSLDPYTFSQLTGIGTNTQTVTGPGTISSTSSHSTTSSSSTGPATPPPKNFNDLLVLAIIAAIAVIAASTLFIRRRRAKGLS